MPPADTASAVPLLVFAAVSLAACGAYAFGVPRSGFAATREGGAAMESPTTFPPARLLAWMLALPGSWLMAFWAAEAKSLPARGVVAGLLVGVLLGAACLGMARKLGGNSGPSGTPPDDATDRIDPR
ncbi:MAG: hypothetical protein WD069_06945 [Planctomycetales bacterium]